MATWRLSDGTEVDSGGVVRGQGVVASLLRFDVDTCRSGWGRAIETPAGTVRLNVSSDWHVHRWLTAVCTAMGLELTTDYVDAPSASNPPDGP